MGTTIFHSPAKMFVLLLLPALAAAVTSDNFIANGQNVNIANFPFQGSYRTASGSHTCGCVFVGANWVLTAAHCGGSTSYSMQFGTSIRSAGGVVSGISGVLRHPDYNVGPGFTPND